jgi:hypothetical protein
MTYIAKPRCNGNAGLKEFSTALEAVEYLDSEGVIAYGETLDEKIQELGWINKLKEAA